MRKLVLALLLGLCGLAAAAQNQTARIISGHLIDADTKEAMGQATVQLFTAADSIFIGGTLSNAQGNFAIKAPANGTFMLRVSSVGYLLMKREVTIRQDKALELGEIRMTPDAIMLEGAVVTANAAKVMVKKDTLVYNPEAFRTPEGSVVEELIKRMSGAEIDEEGNITINGKTVKKILVDGKEFMLGDTETALKNLPVSIIDRVKFYDQQSDLARITGIEDGEKETVLDFKIKRGMNRGLMTNADVAGGTHHRYAGRGMGSTFDAKHRWVLLGNANNKEEDGGWWNRRGLNVQKMLGTNLNYDDSKRLKLDASVRWNHSNRDLQNDVSSESFYSDQARTFGNSTSKSLSRNNQWNGNLHLEWKPDTLTNVMLRANGSYSTNDGANTSSSATYADDPYLHVGGDPLAAEALATLAGLGLTVNTSRQASLSYSRGKNANGSLQLNRRLSRRGRNLNLRVEGSTGDNQNRNTSNNEVALYRVKDIHGNDSLYYTARYNTTPSDNRSYTLSTTYSEPLWKGAHLQTSYELRYNRNKSDRHTYDFSALQPNIFQGVQPRYRQWSDWLAPVEKHMDQHLDSLQSRYSEYRNYTHNLRLTLRYWSEQYDYNVGFLVQPQHSRFTQDYRGRYVDTLRYVTNLTPTLDFHYKFSDQQNIWLHYRGDTRQPDIAQLLDITDDSNPLWITKGNPGLKPQFTNSLNVYYNHYINRRKRSVTAYANYRTTRNSISNQVTYDPETGGSTSKPENINGNWSADGGLSFNTALDTLANWNVGTDTRLWYNNFVSYVTLSQSLPQHNTTRTMSLNERLTASYRNEWLEVTIDGNCNYQHSRNKLQPNADLDTWRFSYGGSVNITLPAGFTLNTNLHENSRRGYNDPSSNTNELIWNGQLSKTFLRDKTLVVALHVYDLLAQQSNYDRWVGATGRSDTRYNSVNSYAMLHVRYRLNMFGGKIDREGRYDRQWGNRDRGRWGRRW